ALPAKRVLCRGNVILSTGHSLKPNQPSRRVRCANSYAPDSLEALLHPRRYFRRHQQCQRRKHPPHYVRNDTSMCHIPPREPENTIPTALSSPPLTLTSIANANLNVNPFTMIRPLSPSLYPRPRAIIPLHEKGIISI